jgi:hypothetical protein
MTDWIHVVIAIIGFAASGTLAVWRVSWVVSQSISKINEQMMTIKAEFNALLELKEAENGKSIGRVYQRFDEYKTHMEENFVRREMCEIMHDSTSLKLVEFSAATNLKFGEINKKLDTQGEKLDSLILKVAGLK